MMRGHKRGCRCVGCSPATRARGMKALLKKVNPRRASGRYSPAARRFLGGEIPALIHAGYTPERAKAAAMSMARQARLKVPKANPYSLTKKLYGPFWEKRGAQVVAQHLLEKGFPARVEQDPREKVEGRGGWWVVTTKGSYAAARRYLETHVGKKNPLTRAETAKVLRSARSSRALALRSPRAIPSARSRHTGEMLAYEDVARRYGVRPRQFSYMRRPNPRPRVTATLPASGIEVRYHRHGEHAGDYKHSFGRGVKILGLADGSVLIRGTKPLWSKE